MWGGLGSAPFVIGRYQRHRSNSTFSIHAIIPSTKGVFGTDVSVAGRLPFRISVAHLLAAAAGGPRRDQTNAAVRSEGTPKV